MVRLTFLYRSLKQVVVLTRLSGRYRERLQQRIFKLEERGVGESGDLSSREVREYLRLQIMIEAAEMLERAGKKRVEITSATAPNCSHAFRKS
jgi:hypothetical protein